MIISGILYLLYYAILLIASPMLLFSDVSLPSDITAAISQASSYAHITDAVVPVATLVSIILLVVSIEGFVFTYKMIKWIYQKIPGVN